MKAFLKPCHCGIFLVLRVFFLFSIFYIMRLYALISNRCGMMMLILFLAHTLLNMVIEGEYAQWVQKTCSCCLRFSSMGRNDKSTLFFHASFSIFGPLRSPWGQNSGRSRTLASLQILSRSCSTSRIFKL